MANEAVIVELMGQPKGRPVNLKCLNGDAIAKGTLLWYDETAVRTVSGGNISSGSFAGIAAEEKVAGDGATTIGVWTEGIFDLKCNSGIGVTCGDTVALSGTNLIRTSVEADYPIGAVVGKALETASTSEVIQVAVGVYS